MKDLTRFINDELKPRFYAHIPQIFPDLKFKKMGNKYASPLHFDGTPGTGERLERCVITEKQPTKVFDNSRQEAKDIITLFMENNGITEVWEAVKRLCNIVGIVAPEDTQEARAAFKKMEERRTALEQSAERQKKALFSPQGEAELRYLRARGWTDSEIKEAGLGYISPAEAAIIAPEQKKIGSFYTLSIPLYSGGNIYGFKFRTIKEGVEKNDRYTHLKGTRKHLFNLTGVQQADGNIIVVEGELDALHAQIKGVNGIVATGGGYLTAELLSVARDRGIKHLTLLFDRDSAGSEFVQKSINTAYESNISVLVATFPEGETLPDGRPVHDIDEYLQIHTPQDLQGVINKAYTGSKYLLERLIREFEEILEKEGRAMTDLDEKKLTEAVIELANRTPNEVERDWIFAYYADVMGLDGKKAFSKEALRAVADRERAASNALKQRKGTQKALQEAEEAFNGGNVREALSIMENSSRALKRIETQDKYSALLALPTEEEFNRRLEQKKDEIPTSYELSNGKDKEIFSLPSGAITFICAPTSHGKSTFLQNLALQVAQYEGAEGAVLYFTFEEDGDSVTVQMLNKFVGVDLCRNYTSRESNNLRALRHYFKATEYKERFIMDEARDIFNRKKAEFMANYYASGKIRIYYEDYDSAELIEAIRAICDQIKVKAVFIDYIQLLSNKDYKRRLLRTEELKQICVDFKTLCVDLDLPIVVAAQLNREACSPLELHSQKIAEAADLERVANKILCLWNTSFPAQKSKDRERELQELENKYNFKLGSGNKPYIFAKLTKNRGGVVGLEAAFVYNGNTGIIEGNAGKETPIQQTLPLDETKGPF